MIEIKRFSKLKFTEETETLAFSQKIRPKEVLPVGSAVKSRFKKIKIIYVPDDSREIDNEWWSRRSPKSGDDILEVCQIGFAKYTGMGREKDVREEFAEELKDQSVFNAGAADTFRDSGFPPFFEIGSIVFVRKEDAVIYGGCLEDYFHLSEHGVDIAAIADAVEFGGNCEFDHLYESSPYRIANKALHQIPDPPLVEALMAIPPSTSKSTLAPSQGYGEL